VSVPVRSERPLSPAFLKLSVPLPLAPAKTPVPPLTVHVRSSATGLPYECPLDAPGVKNDLPGKQTLPVSASTSVPVPSESVITRRAVEMPHADPRSNASNESTSNVDVAGP
jgi:hypothetical protein